MQKDKRFFFFPLLSDKLLILATFSLVIFGSFMIMSAMMGEAAGDTLVISKTGIRQIVYFAIGIMVMISLANLRVVNFKSQFFYVLYVAVLVLLLSTRMFGSTNGAYAWIKIKGISIQPSEFAKVFMIAFGAKTLGVDHKEKNVVYLKRFLYLALVYFVVIAIYQKDLGSAVVLAEICFIITLIPPYKELTNYHFYSIIIIFGGILLVALLLSPIGTSFLEKLSGNYQIARFLASANPFAYQYDSGYHLIMGLVSFATGGWFGLGYGKSIHKYMNFPNPSTDFILPVIVEETGIIGFVFILLLYGIIFFKLIRYALKVKLISSKMILIGTYTYLLIHFVLNVGGVSGLVPLTGVPLLLVSAGGSSLVATMASLGICESEIDKYRKDKEKCA